MTDAAQKDTSELCQNLYAQKWPAKIVDNGVLVALNPSDSNTFHITQTGEGFVVRRMSAAANEYLSCVKLGQSSGRHALLPNTEWLHSLGGAIPVPINQSWGIRRHGRVTEIVLFMIDRFDRPSYSYCTVGPNDHQLESLFYRRPFDIKEFWQYVRRGNVYDFYRDLKYATYYTTGTDDPCVSIGGELLAPHRTWRYYGTISPGDLYNETSLRSKMGW